ncbi:Flp pilus assembly protein, secretin CpaC [Serratia rubidaea]|nr:Flp pilus assembly protein, secretin CpaC [Serratia rubidaea]
MKAQNKAVCWSAALAGALRCALTLAGIFLAHCSYAQEIYMNPGATQNIQVKGDIDTVFISAPEVVDYEVIGDRGLIIYARDSGRAELVAFDKDGEQIMKATLVVDALLSELQKHITEIAPDSQVTIQKMGKSYVISGTVATEEDRDKVYQIVGEGVGAQQQVTKKEIADVSGNSGGGGEGQNGSNWLNEVVYKG